MRKGQNRLKTTSFRLVKPINSTLPHLNLVNAYVFYYSRGARFYGVKTPKHSFLHIRPR